MNLRKVPQVITDVNVHINGKGYLGQAKKVQLPKVEFNTTESKGAIDVEYSTGALKKLECTISLNGVDSNQLNALGINQATDKVPFVLKSSIAEDRENKPLQAMIKGDIIGFEIKELEGSKEVDVEIKIAVHFYELLINNVGLLLIDAQNMICIIGGVDYFAKIRANLL